MPHSIIVDDSRLVRRVLKGMLQELGFACTEAVNGVEALEHLRRQPPDLLVLDVTMPVMSGLDVLRALRREAARDFKVLVCSANTDLEQIAQAIDLGADEYLMKPFDRELLSSKLAVMGFAWPAAARRSAA